MHVRYNYEVILYLSKLARENFQARVTMTRLQSEPMKSQV